jgi:hypothetical protein
MPLRIDRVDTEIEIMRKAGGGAAPSSAGASDSSAAPGSGGGSETLSSVRGGSELREKLRPIVMEILNDELMRIKRKVGAP